MATTEQIYGFETKFEAATKAVLVAAGLTPLDPRSPDFRERSNLSISFRPGAANGEMVPTADGAEYCAYIGGELTIVIDFPRESIPEGDSVSWSSDPSPVLLDIMAKIRVLMRQNREPLNPDNLDYYEVTLLRPAGDTMEVDSDVMCDVVRMRWTLDFRILPDAFDSIP